MSVLSPEQCNDLISELATRLPGHRKLIERLLIALLAGGHVLIEGPPGVAKTRTVKLFAERLALSFRRVQATPDLLPADLSGAEIYHPPSGEFRFIPGPLFSQVVLVDEINRAPPKVQSALLECMAEGQITTASTTHPLEAPFMVIATQNPIEHEGTYPLPEAQRDRFLLHLQLTLPDAAQERAILDQVLREDLAAPPMSQSKLDARSILLARRACSDVHVADAVRDYMVRLTLATRGEGHAGRLADTIALAASPRGTIALARSAQVLAWLKGRDHVVPDDVRELAVDVLAGRIALNWHTQDTSLNERGVMQAIVRDCVPL